MEMGTVAERGASAPHVARDVWCRLAAALIVGVILGSTAPWPRVWLLGGAVLTGVTIAMVRRDRPRTARHWGWLAAMALSASWLGIRTHYVAADHVGRYLTDDAQLAEVVGEIDGPPKLRSKERGAFGRFNWEQPVTLAVLDLESITVAGRPESVSGKLMLRIDGADHRLRAGQRVRARGWLATIDGPVNPGEFDYRRWLAQRGIVGRLSLDHRMNWERLPSTPSPRRWWQALRRRTAAAANRSLVLGLEDQPLQRGLLQTLLLGRDNGQLDELEDDFRRVGLAHILSISGAHLAILMTIVWMLLRLVVSHPSRAAQGALVVLAVYLMALPINVPILRSAIMAAVFCAGYGLGRRVQGLPLLALACVIVLVWRPMELFSAGFQLSFGIVAALMLYARPVSHRLWPPPTVQVAAPTVAEHVARWAVDYLAVSLVAFIVALPVVAYHFQLISPHAVLLSILSLPVIVVLLGAGYFKILVGLVLPSGSIMLSGPLAWVADMMIGLVTRSADWPGAAIELRYPPSPGWTVAVLAASLALLSGWFVRRRTAMACVAVGLVLWTWAGQRPAAFPGLATAPSHHADAATLYMFAVGDGSCFLLRAGDNTLMFDCGSSAFLDVGEKSIAPSLATLGIDHIDTLMLSHADLDHFSGCLDVADAVPVGRVMVAPHLLDEAADRPAGATAFLVSELTRRGLEPQPVWRGWRGKLGKAELELLWPPRDLVTRRNNDASLVLSVRMAGRRILLNGDIQQQATTALLESGVDLQADITDLPHHGSYVKASPAWLTAVDPQVVLQSSGRGRLRRDKWVPILSPHPARRYITARHGLVTVHVDPRGRISAETYLALPQPVSAAPTPSAEKRD